MVEGKETDFDMAVEKRQVEAVERAVAGTDSVPGLARMVAADYRACSKADH